MRQRQPTESRQRQIAEAALQIIANHGLGKFTTAAIAEQVGLAEGTIFRHFAHKEAIVLAAIRLMQERLAGAKLPSTEDPLEALGAFIKQRLTLVIAHPGVFRAFLSDELAHAAGSEGAKLVRKLKKESAGQVRALLEDAITRKQLPAGMEPELLVRLVQGVFHAFVFTPLPKEWSHHPPAEVAARMWQTIYVLLRR